MPFSRNVSILKQLSSTSGTSVIKVYQPGILNPSTKANSDAVYNGFITSLRLIIDIDSISEYTSPDILITDSDAVATQKRKTALDAAQKIGLNLLSTDADNSSPVILKYLWLLNKSPYYELDLLSYLTDSTNGVFSPDESLYLQIFNLGNGLLSGTDKITIKGSAVEQTNWEPPTTAPTFNINCSGNSTGTGGGTDTGTGTGTGTGTTPTTTKYWRVRSLNKPSSYYGELSDCGWYCQELIFYANGNDITAGGQGFAVTLDDNGNPTEQTAKTAPFDKQVVLSSNPIENKICAKSHGAIMYVFASPVDIDKVRITNFSNDQNYPPTSFQVEKKLENSNNWVKVWEFAGNTSNVALESIKPV